ncbi:nucleic acid-binding protein [Iningainema tapete]|uniref:nucleic acid-binding protein n=1 Tax=Iningainema tapete TaxID=2806730 RepID=UPI003080CDF6
MTRTFIDSGVLIAAARGEGAIAERAMAILQDPNREFASSIFLKLEVLPKAIYNNRTNEVRFYEEYFDAVSYWATSIDRIIQNAYREVSESGLGAMDAQRDRCSRFNQCSGIYYEREARKVNSPH